MDLFHGLQLFFLVCFTGLIDLSQVFILCFLDETLEKLELVRLSVHLEVVESHPSSLDARQSLGLAFPGGNFKFLFFTIDFVEC